MDIVLAGSNPAECTLFFPPPSVSPFESAPQRLKHFWLRELRRKSKKSGVLVLVFACLLPGPGCCRLRVFPMHAPRKKRKINKRQMASNSMSMESQRTRWNVKSAYSSVGRAGDCSCSADISRSLVRFRVGGIFTLLVRVPGGCMFHALSREGHAPHAAKSRCESPAWVLPLFWDFSFTPLF